MRTHGDEAELTTTATPSSQATASRKPHLTPSHHVPVELKPLAGAPLRLLRLLLLFDLRCLRTHLTGTRQRAVNLACAHGQTRNEPESEK